MADKNLHDIKIDDLDKSKKNPLKNILTLLALLFVILVISVVITRLILDPDEDSTTLEANNSSSTLVETERESESSESSTGATAGHLAAAAVGMGAAAAIVSNPKERNVSNHSTSNSNSSSSSKDNDAKVKDAGSKIKGALRERQPLRVKELPTPKHVSVIPKKPKPTVHKAPKKTATVHHTSAKHVDKVVATRRTTHSKSVEAKVRTGIYIKVGSFKDVSNAVKKIKKTGLNYALVKTKNDRTITRVLVGPFKSNWGAQQHLPSVRNNIAEGAYITRIK